MASIKRVNLSSVTAFCEGAYQFVFTLGSDKKPRSIILDYEVATATQSLLSTFESYLKATYGRHIRVDWAAYEYCPAF